ncbi:MAG: amidohydrolase family protein [Spirochaetes bacterium]|nr:amidohydrolase family protein [Spirochaetota bacterium]
MLNGKRYCYDIHCHVMNLSHPNLLAFIRRIDLDRLIAINAIPFIGSIIAGANLKKIANLLSIMEHSICEYLIAMEADLARFRDMHGRIVIAGEAYDRMIITPLVMDFGSKYAATYPDIHYNKLSHKPVREQVIDLLNGIREYADHHRKHGTAPLFEVYPFLGINPDNYERDGTPARSGVRDLLGKYFGSVTKESPEARHAKLHAKMGTFSGNINDAAFDYNYLFAGIKVYPPAGYNPWPDDDAAREKVCDIYECCIARGIPVTTHCSGGGFLTADKNDALSFASPKTWGAVLADKVYPSLTVNLAHFGGPLEKKPTAWAKAVSELARSKANVYTDISYLCFSDEDYRRLNDTIVKTCRGDAGAIDRLKSKICFGTDFMINLLHTDSYTSYFEHFSSTAELSFADRNRFISENPERFLFG